MDGRSDNAHTRIILMCCLLPFVDTAAAVLVHCRLAHDLFFYQLFQRRRNGMNCRSLSSIGSA